MTMLGMHEWLHEERETMAIRPDFSPAATALANEAFAYIMNEFEGGDWREQFDALSDAEKAALFIAIADAFSDTTEE